MKLTWIALGLTLSVNTLASTVISGNATGIKLSFVNVTSIYSEFKPIPCTLPDSDLNDCKWPTASKKIVQVTVDYHSSSIADSEESFVTNFDLSDFTAEELTALSSRNAGVRMRAGRNLFEVKVVTEYRTVSQTVCQADSTIDCIDGRNSYTDTYVTKVKVVNVVRN